MKIAVFGSAFNPPTNSHLKIIRQLTESFDKVLVVPCYSHNFGKKMISYHYRVEMARLLVEDLGDRVEVSTIEEEIFQNETSRTYLLLKELKRRDPINSYVFVCGIDNLEKWEQFYEYEAIDREFGKHVVECQGEVRSTLVRSLLNEKKSVIGMTKEKIIDYILTHSIQFNG